MKKAPSVRSERSSQPSSDDSNAYAAADDWTVEDLGTLTSSIQQHAANLRGDEDTEQLETGAGASLESRPVQGLSQQQQTRSVRSFNSFRSERSLSHNSLLKQPKSALRQTNRYSNSTAVREVVPVSKLTRAPKFPSIRKTKPTATATATVATNVPTKNATKIRALIALLCLVISVILALVGGHGNWGLWLARRVVGSPGTTAAGEGPTVVGIPGAAGAPVYNGTFEIPNLESMNIILQQDVEQNLADWRIPFPAANRTEVPLFWDISKSGSTVVRRILGQCLGLVQVSNLGASHNENTLQIFETPQGIRYVNVDSTTLEGLQRAKVLELVRSGLAEVVFTPFVIPAAGIFTEVNKGRMFTVLRHPLERAMSYYQAARAADPAVAAMSLLDYATNLMPNNEMVRVLTNQGPDVDLSDNDLYYAMEVLRRKCVIGLVDRMEESMIRFHGYFGWFSLIVNGVSQCQANLLAPNQERVPQPAEGSEAYNIMLHQLRLDLRLYEYALYLYDVQGGTSQQGEQQ